MSAEISPPGRHQRDPPERGRSGTRGRPAGHPAPRLPRKLVRLAAPDRPAGPGRLPGRRPRPARVRRERQAAGVASYRLDALVADVVGLVAAYGRDRAAIVGHDWGGIVAWAAIERHPDRFDRAVILNAPHPAVMQRASRQDLGQIRRSWYVLPVPAPLAARSSS